MAGFTLAVIALGVSRTVCGLYVCRTGDRKLHHKASQAGESNWLWWQSVDWWMCQHAIPVDQSVVVQFHVHSVCWQCKIRALSRGLQVYPQRVIVVFQDVWSLRRTWFFVNKGFTVFLLTWLRSIDISYFHCFGILLSRMLLCVWRCSWMGIFIHTPVMRLFRKCSTEQSQVPVASGLAPCKCVFSV